MELLFLKLISNRLGSWRNRFVSLGGGVVLINSIQNSNLIFYLSFMNLSTKAWKRICRIHKRFLWGGLKVAKKIPQVSQVDVCRPKDKGQLEIRYVRFMNQALLGKWRCRFLFGSEGPWKDILCALQCESGIVRQGEELVLEICVGLVGMGVVVREGGLGQQNWFSFGVVRIMMNGALTSFWEDVWRVFVSQGQVPQVVSVIISAICLVDSLHQWVSGTWVWDMRRREVLFVWEQHSVEEFLDVLEEHPHLGGSNT